ncbi:MAG: response regulator [Planctomycetes bacterium]|nr:response regulator [Planctomycetota bacterium]
MPELQLDHPIKVLLVEDDPAQLFVLQANLAEAETARFDLTPAEHLKAALAALERARFDVVLLDLGLPDSQGLGTLAAVHRTAPRVPIVVLTGHADEALAVRAAQTGAQDYLVKGFVDNQSLVRAIRYAIERKRAEEALRQSEERLRFALAAGRMGIWEWQVDEDHLTISDELFGLLGVDRSAWPGTFGGLVEQVHPDDREALEAVVRAARRPGARDEHVECAFRLAGDDDVRWALLKGRVVRGLGGRALRLTGTLSDVTEHKQLEARLLQSQKLESIGRLAGGVAHDFNNLLTVILGSTYLAERDPMLTPGTREHLDAIREAAERAGQLTSQLLAFARKQVLRLRVLDQGQVVREMHGMLRRLVGEDVALRVELAPDLWPVRADRAQLEQVLVNLVVNARDAMPDGGALSVATANAPLGEDAGRLGLPPGDYVRLTVKDTGVGMDAATREHVFEPFFTTKGRAGTGLGLATCYGIVSQLGGQIAVDSAPAEGSTFTVLLPRVDERPEQDERPPEAVQGGREVVLVVEDEPLVRNLAVNGLSLHGYRVIAAPSPQEALRVAKEHPGAIDLLVTDVVMPGMSGRQLADEFRALRPGAPVVFMSGYADVALEPGARFLQKPFTPAALARVVREALDARARRGG